MFDGELIARRRLQVLGRPPFVPHLLRAAAYGGPFGRLEELVRGRVEIASFLGTAIQYVVHTAGGEEFTAVEQNRMGAEPDSIGPGREVTLAWDPAHSILVAKESPDA